MIAKANPCYKDSAEIESAFIYKRYLSGWALDVSRPVISDHTLSCTCLHDHWAK